MLVRERISLMRKQRGISTTDMGKMLDVSQATISRYENGTVKYISHEKLEAYASIFECSVSDLIKDDPSYDYLDEHNLVKPQEAILVSDEDDINLLKWFHSLSADEKCFFIDFFKQEKGRIMLLGAAKN